MSEVEDRIESIETLTQELLKRPTTTAWSEHRTINDDDLWLHVSRTVGLDRVDLFQTTDSYIRSPRESFVMSCILGRNGVRGYVKDDFEVPTVSPAHEAGELVGVLRAIQQSIDPTADIYNFGDTDPQILELTAGEFEQPIDTEMGEVFKASAQNLTKTGLRIEERTKAKKHTRVKALNPEGSFEHLDPFDVAGTYPLEIKHTENNIRHIYVRHLSGEVEIVSDLEPREKIFLVFRELAEKRRQKAEEMGLDDDLLPEAMRAGQEAVRSGEIELSRFASLAEMYATKHKTFSESAAMERSAGLYKPDVTRLAIIEAALTTLQ